MPVSVSGQSVPALNEFQNLEYKLNQLERDIRRVDQEARTLHDGHRANARNIEALQEAQKKHADKLEKSIKELDGTLTSIAKEVDGSAGLLVDTNKHLAEAHKALAQSVASSQEEAEAEVVRRRALTGSMEQLLDQHTAQANALRQAFATVQSNLTAVSRAEQDGTHEIQRAIDVLSGALSEVGGQTHNDLQSTVEAIQSFANAKEEHTRYEEQALEQLLSKQDCLEARLRAMLATAGELAASARQAQEHQSQRLARAAAWHAQELNHQAAVMLNRGDCAAAIPLLEEAASLSPESAVICTNLAVAYRRTQQFDRADELLQRILISSPDSVTTLNELAVLYLERDDPQTAMPYLERASHLGPDDAVVWMNLGKAYYGCDKIVSAIEAWQCARQLEPALGATDVVVKILLDEQDRMDDGHG